MENKLEHRKLGRIDQESTVVIYGAASLGKVTQEQADESIQWGRRYSERGSPSGGKASKRGKQVTVLQGTEEWTIVIDEILISSCRECRIRITQKKSTMTMFHG